MSDRQQVGSGRPLDRTSVQHVRAVIADCALQESSELRAFSRRHDAGVAGNDTVDKCGAGTRQADNENRAASLNLTVHAERMAQRFGGFETGLILHSLTGNILTHQGLALVQPVHGCCRVGQVLMHFCNGMGELKPAFNVSRVPLLPSGLKLRDCILLWAVFRDQREIGARRNILRRKLEAGSVRFPCPLKITNELQGRTKIEEDDRIIRRGGRGLPVKGDRFLMPIQGAQRGADRCQRETVRWL